MQAGRRAQRAVFIGFFAASSLIGFPPAIAPAATTSLPGTFVPITPSRLLDTRSASDTTHVGSIGPNESVPLQVTGRGGVPSAGVGAVALNVTVTGATGPGYVTVVPGDEDGRATQTSNVNFVAGQTIANLLIVPLSTDGKVSLDVSGTASAQLVVDVDGYSHSGAPSAPGAYGSLTPARLLDTRLSADPTHPGKVGPGTVVALGVVGRGGVPASGVSSVLLNVTVTGPTGPGFVSVYPDGTTIPAASNINFNANETIANLVTAPVGSDGKAALYVSPNASTDLVVDVEGYFLRGAPVAAGAFAPLTPTRIVDTRLGSDATHAGIVPPNTAIALQVNSRAGVPATGVSSVTLNVTVTGASGSGFVVAYADGTATPLSSNLNFARGQTVANLVTAPVGSDGKVALYVSSTASTQLIVDIEGYYRAVPVPAGPVWGWGRNDNGAVGNGTLNLATTPTPILGLTDVTQVSGGPQAGYAVTSDGRAWAWGDNGVGELGNGTTTSSSRPVQITGLDSVTAVAGSWYDGYALTADGSVWAWGYNADGELGDGTTANSLSPVRVLGLPAATAIAVSQYGGYALTSAGTVWAWGDNTWGELGGAAGANALSPVEIPGLASVESISAGTQNGYALLANGQVWSWGMTSDLGIGQIPYSPNGARPAVIPTLSDVVSIAGAYDDAYAVTSDGTVWAWGYNGNGQLGNGTNTGWGYTPTAVGGLPAVSQIVGGTAAYALTTTGHLFSWGENNNGGALGIGSQADSFIPVEVTGLTNVIGIGAGASDGFAITGA